MKKKGYLNGSGYMLILDNGELMQFATEEEADEYLKDEEKKKENMKNRYVLYINEDEPHYIIWDTLFENERCKIGKKSNKIEDIIEQFKIKIENIRSGKPEK